MRPTKYRPASFATMPRSWRGSVAPMTGRSIQSNACRNPVHHTTFSTSRTRSSSSKGTPFRAPITRPTRSTLARAQVLRFDANQWHAVGQHLRTDLAPDWCIECQDAVEQATQHQSHQHNSRGGSIDPKRNRSGIGPSEVRRVCLGKLECNLGARVAGANDEHATGLQLRRVAVLA